MKTKWITPIIVSFVLAWPLAGRADDTQIYGSSNVAIQPNVLILFDNSGSMNDSVPTSAYDPATDYSSYGSYGKNTVYRSSSGSWASYITNVSSLSTWCPAAYTSLTTAGQYTGRVQNTSGCGTTTRTTALGNYLNYLASPQGALRPKIDIAHDTITSIIQNTQGVRFGLEVFGSTMDADTEGGHIVTPVEDMDVVNPVTGNTNRTDLIAAVQAVTAHTYTPLAESLYEAGLYFKGSQSYFNQSSAAYNPLTDYSSFGSYSRNTVYRSVSGTWSSFITDVNTISCSTAKNALKTNGFYHGRLSSTGTCPSSGTRYDFDTGNYLNYQNSLALVYTTPIQYSCQKNYIVIMTDGDPTDDDNSILATAVGDTDGDGHDPGGAHEISYSGNGTDWLDDVAKKWYDEDLLSSANVAGSGQQNIQTYTIGFSTGSASANALLAETASNGRGEFFAADNAADLVKAFLSVIGSIVEANTSFVAPVVPISPENKTYSGDYVYIGFFRPGVNAFWSGNLKKYAIYQGQIMGSDSATVACDPKTGGHCVPATNTDGDNAGSFIEHGVYSYWSSVEDGGAVEKGGVGQQLLGMTLHPDDFTPNATPFSPTAFKADPTTRVREIYTHLGVSTDLKDPANQFEIANASITPAAVGLTASDTTGKDDLIKFIFGQDAYNSLTTDRDWILGDVLHSGPVIVSYDAGTAAGHTARSVIYVGGNDGMMHAFDDATGAELWGYIPSNQLSHLNTLHGTLHPYFVDGSPKTYILDNNMNGVIEATDSGGNHDKVILIFGERRGEGTAPSFHALDVTDPDNPKFLWDVKRGDSGLAELGETWSTPNIVKVNVTGGPKNVFFVGGGYDPVNEDNLPATADVEGRALYAIEVETGNRVWSYENASHALMRYAIPSDVMVLDTNRDGYVDLLYVGDTGGRMWRFDISNVDVSQWSGKIMFSSNSGGSMRKIMYPPDVTREPGYYYLYFGTGDREHPLDVTGGTGSASSPCAEGAIGNCDRIYAVKDFDNSAYTSSLGDANLTNVTTDVLQGINSTQTDINAVLGHLNATDCLSDTGCGWYIALTLNLGERVVGSPVLFNKVVNVPTFQPTSTNVEVDPCLADVGVGRVYAVNYKTGEAVFNYSVVNDVNYSNATNTRAQNTTDTTLLTRDTGFTGSSGDDRVKSVGAGIPSEVVIVIPESGNGACDAVALAGIGGGVAGLNTNCGGTTQRIFWRQLM